MAKGQLNGKEMRFLCFLCWILSMNLWLFGMNTGILLNPFDIGVMDPN